LAACAPSKSPRRPVLASTASGLWQHDHAVGIRPDCSLQPRLQL
jgi:hypothetical protein